MSEQIEAPFWFVWNPAGRNPQHRHDSRELAITEAERLARNHPGETFIVLQSVCARRVDNMQRIDMRPDLDMEIPF